MSKKEKRETPITGTPTVQMRINGMLNVMTMANIYQTVEDLFRFPPSDIRTHVTATAFHKIISDLARQFGSPNRKTIANGRKMALVSLNIAETQDSKAMYDRLVTIAFNDNEGMERRRAALWCVLVGLEYFLSNEFAKAFRDAMRSVSRLLGASVVFVSDQQKGGK